MTSFTLKIQTDNAAFYRNDGEDFAPDPGPEIARILRSLAYKLEHESIGANAYERPVARLFDVSGNDVGYVRFDVN